MTMLEAKNISICFGQHTIVDDVAFSIGKGELIGLVGPNGAGKSTLLKGLARLLPLKGGTVTLDGQPLESVPRKALSKRLSYLAQGDVIHWPLDVERVVGLGRLPHLSGWQSLSEEDTAVIDRSIDAAEIGHLRRRTATKLSGGEKRLVMIARALAVGADILLADEPVSGLDPNHQIQVMELMKALAQAGRGVVVVLHDLSLAARFCDRVYLMNKGKMAVDGPPREVLSADHLKAVYHISAKYGDEKGGAFYVVPWARVGGGNA